MEKVTVYRVVNWEDHYENNRTKDIKEMRWVPFKNSHDGDGYCQMVAGEMGAGVFGAWCACVQVASRCRPRGTLLRKGNTPHDAVSLASRTRLSLSAFEEMLRRAVLPTVKWLELVEIEVDIVANPFTPQEGAGFPQAPADPSIPFHSIPSIQKEGVQGEKTRLHPVTPPPTTSPQFAEAWASWMRHVSEKPSAKRPTRSAVQKQLEKITAWGEDRAIAAITLSIERNWQSIYEAEPARQNGNGHAKPPPENPFKLPDKPVSPWLK